MKLEPNMYVRTKWGIAKYIANHITKTTVYRVIDKKIVYDNIEDWEDCLLDNEITKASHNIIDLIQSKDLIVDTKNNLYVVDRVEGDYVFTTSKNEYGLIITLVDYQIKSIVTKEQFEAMKYEIK